MSLVLSTGALATGEPRTECLGGFLVVIAAALALYRSAARLACPWVAQADRLLVDIVCRLLPVATRGGRWLARVALACAVVAQCTRRVSALYLGEFNCAVVDSLGPAALDWLGWSDPLVGAPMSTASAHPKRIDWTVLSPEASWVGAQVRVQWPLGFPAHAAHWVGASPPERPRPYRSGGAASPAGPPGGRLGCVPWHLLARGPQRRLGGCRARVGNAYGHRGRSGHERVEAQSDQSGGMRRGELGAPRAAKHVPGPLCAIMRLRFFADLDFPSQSIANLLPTRMATGALLEADSVPEFRRVFLSCFVIEGSVLYRRDDPLFAGIVLQSAQYVQRSVVARFGAGRRQLQVRRADIVGHALAPSVHDGRDVFAGDGIASEVA